MLILMFNIDETRLSKDEMVFFAAHDYIISTVPHTSRESIWIDGVLTLPKLPDELKHRAARFGTGMIKIWM